VRRNQPAPLRKKSVSSQAKTIRRALNFVSGLAGLKCESACFAPQNFQEKPVSRKLPGFSGAASGRASWGRFSFLALIAGSKLTPCSRVDSLKGG
jgi:hypothetical protein